MVTLGMDNRSLSQTRMSAPQGRADSFLSRDVRTNAPVIVTSYLARGNLLERRAPISLKPQSPILKKSLRRIKNARLSKISGFCNGDQ